VTEATTLLVSITPNELEVIGHVLFPYAKVIRYVIPPSPARDVKLATIENLRRRIAAPRSSQHDLEGEAFPLTVAEVTIIDAALKHFVTGLRQLFPASTERDETIAACEKFRRYLVASFSPPSFSHRQSNL
jgi:hypothetical protein